MQLQPYTFEELEFAWVFRVYLRWRTHRRRPDASLGQFSKPTLAELLIPYHIKLLELAGDPIEQRCLVSLLPRESVSAAASKIKGRVSHWLNNQSSENEPLKRLARGYFAATTGKSTAGELDAYLDRQSEHHGYDKRARPPIFVRAYESTPELSRLLAAEHAVTSVRFHIVLATKWRHGVFSEVTAQAVTERWRANQPLQKMFVEKVSFVPDHVHVAVQLHPAVSPAQAVVALMNDAQELMWSEFEETVIRAKVERLWQPSAYVGSFGDLTSSAVSAYVRRWDEDGSDG
jgi:putative transposase